MRSDLKALVRAADDDDGKTNDKRAAFFPL